MEPMDREDVRKAVERRGPSRVPTHMLRWYNSGTLDKHGDELHRIGEPYPNDIVVGGYPQPDWKSLATGDLDESGGIDAHVIVQDYDTVDAVCEQIRQFGHDLDFTDARTVRDEHPDRYVLAGSWFCLYERLWSLRGMENVLRDFHIQPDQIRQLMEAIADFHIAGIHHFGQAGYDGWITSDDLGTQNSTMFSPAIFEQFYRPLYTKIFGVAHDYGMHTWLHTCGAVTEFLPRLIECGLDVVHPIQHTTYPGGVSSNDPKAIARDFAGRITFWAGVDVQYLLPLGSPEEVRAGVRELIDTFDGPDGGCIVGAGNAIMPETPLENMHACFDEVFAYGAAKRRR